MFWLAFYLFRVNEEEVCYVKSLEKSFVFFFFDVDINFFLR